MKTVCGLNLCTFCGACIDICSKKAIDYKDDLECVNAVIDETKCISCGLCEKVCQVISKPMLLRPGKWFQGWSNVVTDRARSSSGAFAYTLAKQMILEGGYVVSCKFKNGEFRYSITNNVSELDEFRESKYVKSNPGGIYRSVKKLVNQNEKVLFIGLPCHVGALKNYLGRREHENLITVDLICHGSPSADLLERFLNQYDLSLKSIEKIHFRRKGNFRLTAEISENIKGRHIVSFTQPDIRDKYSIAFLNGLIYTENCYHCYYAGIERVSDITIGDSWGSNLSEQDKKQGISLALCQTQKGVSLLKRSDLSLYDVNLENAIAANHQLREPFPKPKLRNIFFSEMKKHNSFNRAVRKCFPKICFRLDLKNFLLKIHILKNTKCDN